MSFKRPTPQLKFLNLIHKIWTCNKQSRNQVKLWEILKSKELIGLIV